MKRSLYVPKFKNEVVAEYAEASRKATDFEKAKWDSQESMANRFRLGLSVIEWRSVRRWLDVGCGTGMFFTFAEDAGHCCEAMVGVDITPEILIHSRNRTYASPANFFEADLEAMPGHLVDFDLVTIVGVLQQCGAPLERALAACIERLRHGGQFFLTTKHLGWKAFTDGSLSPEPSHSWFDYGELAGIIQNLGIEIVRPGGFLPREGKMVLLEQSHTLYILGKKLS